MADLIGQFDLNNFIQGTQDADRIEGQNWNDWLAGFAGADAISGRLGNDHLYGGADADELRGGANNDHLEGGCGADWLDGGAAVDVLVGGEGDDTFHFLNRGHFSAANNDRDIVTDFTCEDTITADGFGDMTWDADNANLLNKAGFVVAHLDGLEGSDLVATHAPGSLHWEWSLA